MTKARFTLQDEVGELVAYIERGPGRAQVTDVQLAPRAVQGLRGFDVR